MASSSCAHGRTFTASERYKTKLLEACNALQREKKERIRRENDDGETNAVTVDFALKSVQSVEAFSFWRSRKHLVDAELCKLSFALAAEALMKDDTETATMTLNQALYIKATIDLGLRSIEEVAVGANRRTLIDSFGQTETASGRMYFIAENLPCSCLNPILAQTGKRTEQCAVCLKEQTLEKLYICGGCQVTRFCSRECQRNGWKRHKEYCRNWQEAEKENGHVDDDDDEVDTPVTLLVEDLVFLTTFLLVAHFLLSGNARTYHLKLEFIRASLISCADYGMTRKPLALFPHRWINWLDFYVLFLSDIITPFVMDGTVKWIFLVHGTVFLFFPFLTRIVLGCFVKTTTTRQKND